MEIEELRLNNWVTDTIDNEDCMVTLDDFACIGNFHRCSHPAPYKPITLTPVWLYVLGFKHNVRTNTYVTPTQPNFVIIDMMDKGLNLFINLKSIKLISVHQLQNLYFALTGEELTAKG